MSSKSHRLRLAYPNLFGGHQIGTNGKRWFSKSDIVPLLCIVGLFVLVAWNTGVIEPQKRINELRGDIERTSFYFDDRAAKTLGLIDTLREKLNLLNLGGALSKRQKGGAKINQEVALSLLNQTEQAVARLTLNKPNDKAVEARLSAAIEFALLSHEIVKARDLEQYGRHSKAEAKSIANEKPSEGVGPAATSDIKSLFTGVSLKRGSETNSLIEQGRATILKAEMYLDPLNETELKAKALLEQFDGETLPQKEYEVLQHIKQEWQVQYLSVLEHWKTIRRLEIAVDEEIEKQSEQSARQVLLESVSPIEPQRDERDAKVSTKELPDTITPSKKQTRPKSNRSEKRKKALELLN